MSTSSSLSYPDIPSSLQTQLNTKNLENIINQTRQAVSSNAKVLESFCSKVDELEKKLSHIEDSTVKEIEHIKVKADEALQAAKQSMEETGKLKQECITRDEFRKEQEKWETRLQRLEEVNRELLEHNMNKASTTSMVTVWSKTQQHQEQEQKEDETSSPTPPQQQRTTSSQGPLSSFISNLISQQTQRPFQSLYDQISQEWDSAFTSLSDEAFREIHSSQSDLRMFEQKSLRFIEESKRQSMQLTRETSTDSALMLQRAVDFLLRYTKATIDEAGFAVRHEVSSMLFQTKKQVALLQRAVTRLRNTLCLGPDTETIEDITAGSLVKEMSSHRLHLMEQQKQLQKQNSLRQQQEEQAEQSEEEEEEDNADFGQHRPERKRGKYAKRKKKHTHDFSSSGESSSTDDGEPESPEVENTSLLLPKDFLTSSSSPTKKDKNNNKKKKKKSKHQNHYQQHQSAASPLDAFLMTTTGSSGAGGVGPYAGVGGGATPSEVDIRNILNTPIFSALRNLIEESARNEIDAHNTIRETQFTSEMEDLRQAVMRKVNLETVQRLIERGKDRKAQQQLEHCVKSIDDLHHTVLKEYEWKALLKSKADFSEIDSVRVHCSGRIQGLEEAVHRMERALVVGFGESLNIAPPKTFEKLEEQRVEADAERQRLFLERGSIDDTLIVSKSEVDEENKGLNNNNRNTKIGSSLEKDLVKTPRRPSVQDARSVVVQNRRDMLHSAPPSRPGTNNSSATSIRPNSAMSPKKQLLRTGDANNDDNVGGHDTNNNTPMTSPLHQNNINNSRNSNQRPQTAQSNVSRTTSSNAATIVMTSHLPQNNNNSTSTPKPPRHDLIYSSSSGSGGGGRANQQFSDALKNRCNLDDDAVKKW